MKYPYLNSTCRSVISTSTLVMAKFIRERRVFGSRNSSLRASSSFNEGWNAPQNPVTAEENLTKRNVRQSTARDVLKHMKNLTILLLIIFCSSLIADEAEEQLKKLNIQPVFYYETPFSEQCFAKISGADILYGGFEYRSLEMDIEIFSSSHYFLIDGNNINFYGTVYQLFTSPEFVKTIRSDYKITTKDEAAIFQDLLFLIDQRSSWTSFFKQENDWFFIRRTFFEDIEAWKVTTDGNGVITSIQFSQKMAVTIPEEVYQTEYPSIEYDYIEEYIPSDAQLQQIKNIINKQIKYIESARELINENLTAISDARFYEFIFNIEEEIEDEEYGTIKTSQSNNFGGILFNEDLQLYDYFTEMLVSPLFLESINSSYLVKTESDALIFEAMLDEYTNYMKSQKKILFDNDVWYFVRDESFGRYEGFTVSVNSDGEILNIAHSVELDIEIPEEEFDESTADWGFGLLFPESNTIEVVEGTAINYAVEFNYLAAAKLGAWILVKFDGQNNSMYAGTEIYSPYYGDIPGNAITLGKHVLEIYLMRPGMDLETAIEKASVEINVIPFNDEGVEWNFTMVEPARSMVESSQGESVPVILNYNATEANRLGVRIEIYFEGELVGGQNPPYHESPFKIDIPGGELDKGKNNVEFVFVGGKKTLAKFEVTVDVK